MPRPSRSHILLSDAALGSLMNLGTRLKEARLRRNWTQSLAAEKAGLSTSSIKKIESGSAHISVSAYLALLDIYGQPTGLDHVFATGSDSLGEALSRSNLRQRAGTPRHKADIDEWEL
jgi:transcriptional regulator with XRE-family HTH domain